MAMCALAPSLTIADQNPVAMCALAPSLTIADQNPVAMCALAPSLTIADQNPVAMCALAPSLTIADQNPVASSVMNYFIAFCANRKWSNLFDITHCEYRAYNLVMERCGNVCSRPLSDHC